MALRLVQLLRHPPLQQYVYGGKGVGSQGDGTAQLLCKSGEATAAVMEVCVLRHAFPVVQEYPTLCFRGAQIIERDFPGMSCYPQVLGSKPHIRTAVIPTAGLQVVACFRCPIPP
jgi:hypothetical protein